jgi:plastocyanin
MKRLLVAVALCLVSSSCFGGGPETRTLLMDYSNDQFASAYLGFFPYEVAVHPGDTLVVKQTWTGEPHTFTGGKLVEPLEKVAAPYLVKYHKNGFADLPPVEPPGLEKASAALPEVFDQQSNKVAQNGSQPCYLDTGTPPKDINKPCPHRAQPAFTGREALYSSGYVHYAGPSGNTYRMPIAKNATPGRYYFFCLVHGPLMSTYVDIRPKSQKIPSQEEVTRTASKEIDVWTKPLLTAWNTANAGKVEPPPEAKDLVSPGSRYFKGIFMGFGALPNEKVQFEADITEFIPRKTTAKVNTPVTWTTFGGHTISFDVPKYFPLFTIKADGTVIGNPETDKPAGGAPDPGPPQDKSRKVDGGTWDGTHFWSSGRIDTGNGNNLYVQYTLRFSRPGTYKYACLIHPAMVAELTITP